MKRFLSAIGLIAIIGACSNPSNIETNTGNNDNAKTIYGNWWLAKRTGNSFRYVSSKDSTRLFLSITQDTIIVYYNNYDGNGCYSIVPAAITNTTTSVDTTIVAIEGSPDNPARLYFKGDTLIVVNNIGTEIVTDCYLNNNGVINPSLWGIPVCP